MQDLSVKTGKKAKDKVTAIKHPQEIKIPAELLLASEKDPIIQSYDILAIQPTTAKVFQEACKTYNIDLISLDLSQRLDGMLYGKSARAAVGCAISRGIYFEIVYSPMIRDCSARRLTITNANLLVELCRGKNIIISSGTQKAIELRSPYDVANLGLLFGLTEEQARNAVSDNCRSLLLHAAARKSANGVVHCSKKPLVSVNESVMSTLDVELPPNKKRKLVDS